MMVYGLVQQKVYWIDGLPSGRLGIGVHPNGHEWLTMDIQTWRRIGVDGVVSLLAEQEIERLGLDEEAAQCAASGITFVQHTIPANGLPYDTQLTLALVQDIVQGLEAGKSIVIHCDDGLDRAPMMAAAVLIQMGDSARRAFMRLKKARGERVPQLPFAVNWVKEVAGVNEPAVKEKKKRGFRGFVPNWLPWASS